MVSIIDSTELQHINVNTRIYVITFSLSKSGWYAFGISDVHLFSNGNWNILLIHKNKTV